MGNAQKRCYEIKSKIKKKKISSPILDSIDEEDKTIDTNQSHQINIIIKKTRKKSINNLTNTTIQKRDDISTITTNRSSHFMNSFNIINSPRRFQSPTNLLNKNNKINLSPLKKVKKSSTIKNIYLKGDLIGEGRFGKVYPGLCTLNAEIVTIKTYDKISQEKHKLIMQNKKQIYKLEHENIVKTILLYEEKDILTAVFDCSNLNSVQELIKEYGTFDESVIQKYSRQLLQGLKYLHEQNIYHKNFTPRNILVDAEGKIKISDCYIDSIILGSAKEIYDNLLSEANNNIEYYIPPFFIQNIFYFGESMTNENKEENKDIYDLKKIFEEWQAFDLWYMGCFLIEISSGKKPWNHYHFKDNLDFFEFLKNTNLIPTIPKKMSLEFHELVQILLNPTLTNKKNIYDIIFNLNFFKKNVNDFIYQKNNKSIVQSSFRNSHIEKKFFEDSSYFADSNIQLGQMLQNNKVKNILNNNNNASFSVTSMEDISFNNSALSNNNNLFNSNLNFSKNDLKSFIEGKINKIKSIKSIKSDMTEVKELQNE